MALHDVRDPRAVERALDEYDRLGRRQFLEKYQFGEARHFVITRAGRQYDSKAIVGAAHAYQHGRPLRPTEFSGGEATVQPLLRRLGFEVVRLDRPESAEGTATPAQTPREWTIQPGDIVTRAEIQAIAGGSEQGGIVPSNSTPNLMIFTDPSRGHASGYFYDGWEDEANGVFLYTGHGPSGDQQMANRNRSILKHRDAGRTLRVFEAVKERERPGGKRHRYLGAFRIDSDAPWSHRPGKGQDGRLRQVIVFRLLSEDARRDRGATKASNPPTDPASSPGRQTLPTGVELVNPERNMVAEFERAPATGATATRAESQLVKRWEEHLQDIGHLVKRVSITVPGESTRLVTDTFDVSVNELYEAKSSSDRATVRLAIGQLFDYLRFVPGAKGLLLLPAHPSPDLASLVHSVGLSFVVESGDVWVRSDPAQQGAEQVAFSTRTDSEASSLAQLKVEDLV